MLQEYRGFYIDGMARMVGEFSRDNYPEAQIYKQGRASSIVQVGRFALPKFYIQDRDLAVFHLAVLARGTAREIEKKANRFSADFLVPETAMRQEFQSRGPVTKMPTPSLFRARTFPS